MAGCPQMCPQLPPEVNGALRRCQDGKKHKKTRFLAGLVDFLGCFRMLSDQVKWWSRGESNTRRNSLKLKQYRSRDGAHTNGSTNTGASH